jgi:hypothetical protein
MKKLAALSLVVAAVTAFPCLAAAKNFFSSL